MNSEALMFISLEGTEGSGKTTLITMLKSYFENKGQQVVTAREPGGTPLAEDIRRLLLSTQHTEEIDHRTELLLFYASRMQNYTQVIKPALDMGRVLIIDRYIDSSISYQSFGRGLDEKYVKTLNELLIERKPDITLWLDLPVEVGILRAKKRGVLDRFEQEKVDFFNKVRSGYAILQQREPQRIIRIDATQPPEDILNDAIMIIQAFDKKTMKDEQTAATNTV